MSTKQRKALGRGFGALLKSVDDFSSQESIGGVAELDINEIAFNPKQPRQEVNSSRLEDLAQSIRIKGIIHPILVRPSNKRGKGYELVAGERRLRASKLAGYDKIPALIKPILDEDLLEIALIENIQRDDLNPIEEAGAYKNLLEEHSYTQEDLSKRIGKNRSTIANFIRLLSLPKEIQTDLAEKKLTMGHARAILSLNSTKEQLQLRDKILAENISVRETEDIIRNKKRKNKPKEKISHTLSSQMMMNQDRLRDCFSTKVSIKHKEEKEVGKIVFEYYNQDDFNRIYSLLTQKMLTDY